MIDHVFGDMQDQLEVWTLKITMVLLVFTGFVIASTIARHLILDVAARTDPTFHFVLQLAVKVDASALLLFGTVTAIGTVGVNVSALVAGVGLTGFTLGFALQDILSNLMSGVLILLYRPFSINDRIAVTRLERMVAEIDLPYTRLEKGDQTYLIPNSLLITNTIGLIQAK